MNLTVYVSIAIICGIFVLSEVLSKMINYKIPPLVLSIFILLILGGELGLLPETLIADTGFADMIFSFGLPFVLAGFGTSMSIKAIKSQWKTVTIALLTVTLIVVISVAIGTQFMDLRTALYGAVEVAGGGQAGLIFVNHAKNIGDRQLMAIILFLMSMQFVIGYPACVYAMRKSMKLRITHDRIPDLPVVSEISNSTFVKQMIKVPAEIKDSFYYTFAMLGVICALGYQAAEITGVSHLVFYILLGFMFAELGIISHNCLQTSNSATVLFSIMYMVVIEDLILMKVSQVAGIVMEVVVLLSLGIVGCLATAFIISKVFKVDVYEAFAISIGCMIGYPPSQKITEETLMSIRGEIDIDDRTALRLKSYYEPQIIISGIVSISMITGILAGFIITFI